MNIDFEAYFNEGELKLFEKGDFIAHQNDTIRYLYLLTKGVVKTEMTSEGGRTLHIETIIAPAPLALAFLFAEKNCFPVDVIALEAVEILLISKELVMEKLANNHQFLQNFIQINGNRTQFITQRLQLLAIKTIKGKLAYYILQESSKENNTFKMSLNQTELADYFGVARPSLARSLAELVDEQIITFHRKTGVILNSDRLKELVNS